MEEALSNYSKAVEKAQKVKDNRLEIFAQNRDRAAAEVKGPQKAR